MDLRWKVGWSRWLVGLVGMLAACSPRPVTLVPVTLVPVVTATPTLALSPTATETPTSPPLPTATATPTLVPSPTATKTPTPTPPPTATKTPTPAPGADLAVQKSVQCSSVYTCLFTITVSNNGPGTYTGPLTVSDQTTPAWSTLLAGGGSVSGAACSMTGGNVVCSAAAVSVPAGQSYAFTFGVYFGPSPYAQPFQNCASLPGGIDGNPSNNQTCIGVTPPAPTPTPAPTATSTPAIGACVVSAAELTAWWRLEDPIGSSSLADALGAHPGALKSLSGAPLAIGSSSSPPPAVGSVGGQVGNALVWNQAYAQIPHSPALNIGPNGLTIAGWLQAPPGSPSQPILQPILDKTYSVSPGCQLLQGYALFLEWDAGAGAYDLVFRMGNGTGIGSRVTAAGAVPPNQRAFVAVTVAWLSGNQAQVQLYVNGSLVQTGMVTGVTPANVASPADLRLAGYQGPLPSNACAGVSAPAEPPSAASHQLALDEIEIWGRVLSPSEIATLYATEGGGQPKCSP